MQLFVNTYACISVNTVLVAVHLNMKMTISEVKLHTFWYCPFVDSAMNLNPKKLLENLLYCWQIN